MELVVLFQFIICPLLYIIFHLVKDYLKRNKIMEYEFRPYGEMQPILVTLTGKVYAIGEHPYYKQDRIIEVLDREGKIHDAFEDEIKRTLK